MNVIYVLIPIAIIIILIAIAVFFWAVRSEQFEDLDRQGHSILFDEELDKPAKTSDKNNSASHNESNE